MSRKVIKTQRGRGHETSLVHVSQVDSEVQISWRLCLAHWPYRSVARCRSQNSVLRQCWSVEHCLANPEHWLGFVGQEEVPVEPAEGTRVQQLA